MAALLKFGRQSTSDNVASVIDESDMNVNVDVGISPLTHSFQYLFPLPVSSDPILNYSSLPTSGSVDSVICKSGMAEKCGQKLESRRHLLPF